MRRALLMSATLLCVAGAASAQGPEPAVGPGFAARSADPIDNTADFLLAHTGELRLTDNQVTRLAAISRRVADRRRAMRDSLVAMRPAQRAPLPRDSAARAQRMQQRNQQLERMRPVLDRAREQALTDRRDAISVLTADQQAFAWELVARRGPGRFTAGGGARMDGRMRGAPMRRSPMRGPGGARGGPQRPGSD